MAGAARSAVEPAFTEVRPIRAAMDQTMAADATRLRDVPKSRSFRRSGG